MSKQETIQNKMNALREEHRKLARQLTEAKRAERNAERKRAREYARRLKSDFEKMWLDPECEFFEKTAFVSALQSAVDACKVTSQDCKIFGFDIKGGRVVFTPSADAPVEFPPPVEQSEIEPETGGSGDPYAQG